MFIFVKAVKNMSSFDRMKKRVEYLGYEVADDRNVTGKYKSFKSALKSSYQAEDIILDKDTPNERQWRCLINPSRLTENFDKKVISIDFESGVKEGTVFWWERTNKYWMINLQQHTEEAYFRGTITRADYELDVEGKKYMAIVKGPEETNEEDKIKHQIAWNNLNYTLALQVEKNSQTVRYFSRHQIVKIKLTYPDVDTGEIIEEIHNWKVVATNKYSSDFLIDVYLDEWYDNELEDAAISPEPPEPDTSLPYIEGPRTVNGYDSNLVYSIVGLTNGTWSVNSNKVKINKMDKLSCELEILTGKPIDFILKYSVEGGIIAEQKIIVQSL